MAGPPLGADRSPLPLAPALTDIANALAGAVPRQAAAHADTPRAAVAVIFRVTDGPEVLFIRRAQREGDPWSGQVALPGGRVDPSDASLVHTAIRETFEETGLALAADEGLLGALDELHPLTPHLPPIVISPYVFAARGDETLCLSHEVADAFWVPWSVLRDPATTRVSTIRVRGNEFDASSFVIGPHVVWGLTERILRNLMRLLPDAT